MPPPKPNNQSDPRSAKAADKFFDQYEASEIGIGTGAADE
jgi:hypothetical protein